MTTTTTLPTATRPVTNLDLLPIGRRVAFLREEHGWSQQMLADKVGMSKSWVDKIERGVRRLDRLSTIRRLENVLGYQHLTAPQRTTPQPADRTSWRHVECGQATPAGPDHPPATCSGCGAWAGNWHKDPEGQR